jgi:dihydrolipoamide dehydrogenase
MEFGISSEDIAMTCLAHPTHPEALKVAAIAVTGKASTPDESRLMGAV